MYHPNSVQLRHNSSCIMEVPTRSTQRLIPSQPGGSQHHPHEHHQHHHGSGPGRPVVSSHTRPALVSSPSSNTLATTMAIEAVAHNLRCLYGCIAVLVVLLVACASMLAFLVAHAASSPTVHQCIVYHLHPPPCLVDITSRCRLLACHRCRYTV